jgi:hypothetical protein
VLLSGLALCFLLFLNASPMVVFWLPGLVRLF